MHDHPQLRHPGYPNLEKQDASRKDVILDMGIADWCVIMYRCSAGDIYLFGPTEWNSFMSIVAGIVQAFLTLQIALVADSAASKGGKAVKKD